jgi:hypothetical protein
MNKEFSLLKQILTHPAAYKVGLSGILEIHRVGDGRFIVSSNGMSEEMVFEGADEAVRFFLSIRDTYHIGLDYELKDIESGMITAKEKHALRKP